MTETVGRRKFEDLKKKGLNPTMIMFQDVEGQTAVLIKSGKRVLFRYPENYHPKLKEDLKVYEHDFPFTKSHLYGGAFNRYSNVLEFVV